MLVSFLGVNKFLICCYFDVYDLFSSVSNIILATKFSNELLNLLLKAVYIYLYTEGYL